MTSRDLLVSPRLATLQQELEAGNLSALDAFWQEVSKQNAPLIELIADNDQEVLVTFLWRAQEETEHVFLKGSFTFGEPPEHQLTRMDRTNLWYRTYRLRKDVRAVYSFSPNNPLSSWDELQSWEDEEAHLRRYWRSDPLNPKTFALPHDDEGPNYFGHPEALLELPDAPPQPFVEIRPGVAHGQVELHRFHSTSLGNERRVWIYTPPGYRANSEPYPLLLIFDGWLEIHTKPTILDNLLAQGHIPPLVAVLVDNAKDRDRELPCYPPFADFLAQELLPWACERYRLTSDPTRRVVAGVSYGGLAAAFAGLRHPELFGNVLSQSGSYWWTPEGDPEDEWLARQFTAADKLPLHFYLNVGLLEKKTDKPYDFRPTQLVANRHLRNILQAKGYVVHYAEYSGGHDFPSFQSTFADGLLALIGTDQVAKTG